MIATVQKWGNSLGVRIPKPLAQDAEMKIGGIIKMTLVNGRLILESKKMKRYSLGTLLKSVTSKNLHEEYDAGEPVGKEVW